MIGTNFMEEIDCGSFFDHIDDLLEFPNDDIDNGIVGKGAMDAFPSLWPENSPDSEFPGSDSVFSHPNKASDLSAELSVPYEDIVQLEWLSTFVEDSFSGGGLTVDKYHPSSAKEPSGNQFQTSSPISVLESSTACSNGKTIPISHEKRARSKRPRPPTFVPRKGIQLISPSSSNSETVHPPPLSSSESESFGESRPVEEQQPKKKKKIKILPPSGKKLGGQNDSPDSSNPASSPQAAVRKCMHCEITKTPQWRAGPMGPKTLCNACGVRYKSGRLFPEYRPAASPTFVPSLHSNSHKKVLEMRVKGGPHEEGEKPVMVATGAGIEAVTSSPTPCM